MELDDERVSNLIGEMEDGARAVGDYRGAFFTTAERIIEIQQAIEMLTEEISRLKSLRSGDSFLSK